MMAKHDINKHLGKRLRQRRTMMGFNQKAIADAIGVTFQQVQKYENGANAMNANRLYEFAQLLRVPVEYFFDEMETPYPATTGFSENIILFDHNDKGVSERETLEIMKAFKRIPHQLVRKRISDLIRAIADNKVIMD